MKRLPLGSMLAALVLTAVGLAVLPARADTVLYQYAALRGSVTTCQWFDDAINDRSLDAMIRQTDELYNRTPLIPGADVTNVQTAPLANGTQVAGFSENGVGLCSGDDAINATATSAEPVMATPEPQN